MWNQKTQSSTHIVRELNGGYQRLRVGVRRDELLITEYKLSVYLVNKLWRPKAQHGELIIMHYIVEIKKIDFMYCYHTNKNQLCKVTDMSDCGNHFTVHTYNKNHVVHLKYIQFLPIIPQ